MDITGKTKDAAGLTGDSWFILLVKVVSRIIFQNFTMHA